MKNLEVTLKATVNNSSLRKLGELRLTSHKVDNPTYGSGGTQRFTLSSSVTQQIQCLDSGSFTDGSGTPTSTTMNISAGANATVVFLNENYDISISDKYKLTKIDSRDFVNISLNIDDLVGCESLTTLRDNNVYTVGNIGSLVGLSLTECNLADTSISGDLSLAPNYNFIFSNTKVTGNISSLGGKRNIAGFQLTDCDVEGSIEELAAAQWNEGNGRTSGTLKVTCLRTNVTYNGSPVTAQKTITFSAGGYSIS